MRNKLEEIFYLCHHYLVPEDKYLMKDLLRFIQEREEKAFKAGSNSWYIEDDELVILQEFEDYLKSPEYE